MGLGVYGLFIQVASLDKFGIFDQITFTVRR